MSEKKLTLGQAIDQIISALEQLDETTRSTAIQAACTHLGLEGTPAIAPVAAHSPLPATPAATAPLPHDSLHRGVPERKVDIRSLKDEKQPSSAKQMACVVAFYLRELAPETERKDTVSTKDLEKHFKQAGFKLPTKVEQVLVDAKRSGYFESTSRASTS